MFKIKYILFFLLIISIFITGCQKDNSNVPYAIYNTELDNTEPPEVEEIPTPAEINGDAEEVDYDVSDLPDNKTNYSLTIEDRAVLEKIKENGFAVVPNKDNMTLYEVYQNCKYTKTPVFVTSDSVLHTSHLIFDWYLRYLEIAHLRSDLINLTDSLLAKSMEYYENAEDEEIKDAALKNSIYFTVAKYLLEEGKIEEINPEIKKVIEEELNLIKEHSGFSNSPLMEYKEDYSQYVPRGHYNRSPEFQSYFKAMIWYGRIYFPIKDNLNTKQAILLCKALKETEVKGETAEGVWKRIYETTAFFSGESDDLLFTDYKEILNKVYGEEWSFESMSDSNKLKEFQEKIKELKKPEILSTYSTDENEDWQESLQSFRLMGQRYTFDAYIFQNLVYDRVKEKLENDKETPPFTEEGGMRVFARGLDVMAVLGSKEAEEVLKDQGDTDFVNYEENFKMLQGKVSGEKQKGWIRDLYNGRLWILQDLFKEPDSRCPDFMKTKAWKLKQVNTSLGSWTELKHDSILYTKQPYAVAQMAISTATKGGLPEPTPEPVKGYVEPSIDIYQRTKILFEKLREKIKDLNYPDDGALENNLIHFENLLTSLETISQKELSGENLTQEEYLLIENIGNTLKSSLSFGHYFDVAEEFTTDEDEKMPVLADVLTDVNTEQVLEEGTGNPFIIYVEVEKDNEKKIYKGATYSYYEFKWPMNDRLTDEVWRKILGNNKEPGLPDWTDGFMVLEKVNDK